MYLCSAWHLFYVKFSNELFIGSELVLFYHLCLLPKVSFDFFFLVAKPMWKVTRQQNRVAPDTCGVIEIARDSILWSGSDIGMDESMVKSCFIKKGEEWGRKDCFEFTQWSLLHTAEFSLNFLSATTVAGAKTYKWVNMCLVMQHCRLHTCVTDKGKSYWAKLALFW
jgi:hypothetical protein